MIKDQNARSLLAWVKTNRPDMYAQVSRWFEETDPNAPTHSLADIVIMGFMAGAQLTEPRTVGWSDTREKSER